MSWSNAAINAGLCIIIVGFVMTVRLGLKKWWDLQHPGIRPNRLESIAELASQVVLWGGMAIMQLGNLIEHMNGRTTPNGLSLTAAAAGLLLVGVCLGRLLMRWQLHHLDATIDGVSGKITRHVMN